MVWAGCRNGEDNRVPESYHDVHLQGKGAGSAGNWSDLSDPFAVTTPAADPNDHEPPTVPPGFWGDVIDGATEAMVFWGNATDNVTAQEHIRYYLFLNGQSEGATVDLYPHQFTMYLTLGIVNTMEVYAVDEAGNRSATATVTIDLRAADSAR